MCYNNCNNKLIDSGSYVRMYDGIHTNNTGILKYKFTRENEIYWYIQKANKKKIYIDIGKNVIPLQLELF